MDFGRLKELDNVDFSLPPSHPQTLKVLGGKPAAVPKIYVGCPVWHDKGWNGTLFPKGAKDSDHLKFYARKFNCIELNTTHYRVPNEFTLKKWKEDTPEGFLFCPKVPQAISHLADLRAGKELMTGFIDRMRLLDDRLGTFFLQLPPYTSPQKRNSLEQLLSVIPSDISMTVELRHEGWFTQTYEQDALCRFLEQKKIGLVITDVAGRRDVLHQRLLTKKALIRFTANNLMPVDYTRMDDWAKLTQEWLTQGLEELYFFMHTPDKALCLEMSEYFLKKMNQPYQHLSVLKSGQGNLF